MSLQGTLRTLGITEVLEFLADRTATGRLDIETGIGTATYWLLDGGIASNEYRFEREDGDDAAEATYYALAELDGTFFFDDDQEPPAGPTEAVSNVLARTATIAEAWSEVEQVVPSMQHWLHRNDTLDGSVTIEPEWWKAIDIIGSGCTAAHLASVLGEGALGERTTDIADGLGINPGRGQDVGRQLRRRRLSVRTGNGDYPTGQTAVCQFDFGDRPDPGGSYRLANLGERTDPRTRHDKIRFEDPVHVVTTGFSRDPPDAERLHRRDLSRSRRQVARIHLSPADPRQQGGRAA